MPPPQHCRQRDDPMHSASLGQQPDQRREHSAVRPGQPLSAHLATEHGDLVAQHQDLGILRS
jgi:hypothetical protein